MTQVAALFVRGDSVYKAMTGVDAWDIERDAMLYRGPYRQLGEAVMRVIEETQA